jgi:hypothetical protein
VVCGAGGACAEPLEKLGPDDGGGVEVGAEEVGEEAGAEGGGAEGLGAGGVGVGAAGVSVGGLAGIVPVCADPGGGDVLVSESGRPPAVSRGCAHDAHQRAPARLEVPQRGQVIALPSEPAPGCCISSFGLLIEAT